MQDTFMRAMRSERVPENPPELRPWLYRIATNAALDHLRRRRRRRFVPFTGREPAPARDAADDELVRRALAAIPPEQAAALVLRLHEGFSRAELAALVGLSEDGVKSRLARARRRFTEAYLRLQAELRR